MNPVNNSVENFDDEMINREPTCETFDKLCALIQSTYGSELPNLSRDTKVDSLPLDSLDMVVLLLDIESDFAVELEVEALTEFNTLDDVCEQINESRN